MNQQERVAISYSHISDEFDEAFINRLHRAQGSTRLLVRATNPDGKPYGISCYEFRIRTYLAEQPDETLDDITNAVAEAGDDYDKKLHNYYMKHWVNS